MKKSSRAMLLVDIGYDVQEEPVRFDKSIAGWKRDRKITAIRPIGFA